MFLKIIINMNFYWGQYYNYYYSFYCYFLRYYFSYSYHYPNVHACLLSSPPSPKDFTMALLKKETKLKYYSFFLFESFLFSFFGFIIIISSAFSLHLIKQVQTNILNNRSEVPCLCNNNNNNKNNEIINNFNNINNNNLKNITLWI